MVVYPEIESWGEFYPSEIFIRMVDTDTTDNLLTVLKKANIGTTINVGKSAMQTETYKKIGDIVSLGDMDSNLILLRRVVVQKPGT